MKVEGNGWTLYRGDVLDVVAGIEAVDHAITDPPYEAEAHNKGRRCRGKVLANGRRKLVKAAIDFAPMDARTRHRYALALGRIVKRWTLVFCQVEGAHLWRVELEDAGLVYKRTGVWTKPDGQPQLSGDRPGVGFEAIVMAHPKGRTKWNGGGKRAVFDFNKKDPATPYGRANEHPTQKPVPLFLELVSLFTDPGELVFDGFAGSATTGIACIRLGRRFVGVERDPKYFDYAVERLRAEENLTTVDAMRRGQSALFANGAHL